MSQASSVMAASWKTEPGLEYWDGGASRGLSRLAGEEEGERDRQADSGDSEGSHSDSCITAGALTHPLLFCFRNHRCSVVKSLG